MLAVTELLPTLDRQCRPATTSGIFNYRWKFLASGHQARSISARAEAALWAYVNWHEGHGSARSDRLDLDAQFR